MIAPSCPCCGSAINEPNAILVSLDTNTVAVGWSDDRVRLHPREAEFLFVVANAKPHTVRKTTLASKLYGNTEWPTDHYLHVLVSQVRRKVKPLGLLVEIVRGVDESGFRVLIATKSQGASA